jgi:hypothetical protein
MPVFGDIVPRRLIEIETDISEVHAASIIRAMVVLVVAVCTSEKSVYFYETTWRYIPEGCHIREKRSFTLIPNR